MATGQRTRILILGGGFGGVATAQRLARRLGRAHGVEITLVNRDNYFVFVPLLASAAAGSLEALHVVAPLRHLLKGQVLFRAEEVTGIDFQRRLVTTLSPTTGREHALPYDHLVIALGNVVNLARLPGVAQHGKPLRTLGDALAIRNHVLQMLEAADIETDPAVRRELTTFVVAGGGFSGVEMVGELNDMVRAVIRYYPALREAPVRVILLHSGERLLPELSPGVADYALRRLRRRGVEVRLNTRLAAATPFEAVLEGGEKIPTRTLIVTVGNAPPPVVAGLSLAKERGRIAVDEYLRVPGVPGVWALGDNAAVPNRAAGDGAISPPTAQFAIRQGRTLADNLVATLRGAPLRPFAFNGLGQLCLVGHGAGVGELRFGIKPRGLLGWALWRGVYWAKMPSLGRKLQVGADWLFDLFIPRELAQVNLARTRSLAHVHYEPGEVIVRQGDPGDHFYLIVSGTVEVVRERSSGAQTVLAQLGPGEYFGETALLTGGRRTATVRCLTPVDVLALGRDDFASLTGAWLHLAEHLRAVSAQRVAAGPATTWIPRSEPLPRPRPTGLLVRAGSGQELVVDADLISLGRSPENQVVVSDPRASRRHALIQRDGDRFWLEDLGSTNGTYHNGIRIRERTPLQDGDSIRVGATEFTFSLRPGAGEPGVTTLIHRLDDPEPPPAGGVTRLIQALDQPSGEGSRSPAHSPPLTPSPPPASGRGVPEGRGEGSLGPGVRAGRRGIPEGRGEDQGTGDLTSLIRGLDATSARLGIRLLLRAVAGPAAGTVFAVGPEGATLGRDADNPIAIADPELSRQHARIEYTGGGFVLRDLDSTNGVRLNGVRLREPRVVHAGDTIEVGSSRLVVVADGV